jgi:hypothetical protein
MPHHSNLYFAQIIQSYEPQVLHQFLCAVQLRSGKAFPLLCDVFKFLYSLVTMKQAVAHRPTVFHELCETDELLVRELLESVDEKYMLK